MRNIKTLKDLLAQVDYVNCETGKISDITGLQQGSEPYIYKVELELIRIPLTEPNLDGKIERALPPTKNKVQGKLVFIKDASKLKIFRNLWNTYVTNINKMFDDKEQEVSR